MDEPAREIGPLIGAPFSGGVLTLSAWKKLKLSGWFGFSIHFEHRPNHLMQPWLFQGIYSRGGKYVTPWADLDFTTDFTCPDCEKKWVLGESEILQLFQLWSRVIPWNGHISIAYESEEHEETRIGLQRGVPPVLTPLGYAGYLAGFMGGYKDWYIAEGGHEGPRKLQMNKPLNFSHVERIYQEFIKEVKAFVKHSQLTQDSYILRACKRGVRWLEKAPLLFEELFR